MYLTAGIDSTFLQFGLDYFKPCVSFPGENLLFDVVTLCLKAYNNNRNIKSKHRRTLVKPDDYKERAVGDEQPLK